MYSLSGKNAVVIGGTRGIGKAVAKSFVESGAAVVITGRSPDGDDVAAEIGASFQLCDSTDEQAIKTGFDQISKQLGGNLDILVVNAGTADDEGSIEEFEGAAMRRLMDVNFNGVFYALKYAPAHLSDGSSIITTGSAVGSGTTHAGAGVYAASKAAVAYLTRTSAIELAPRGIRVNAVSPALIAGTGMMTDDDGGPEAQFLSSLTAFGRMGRQDEIVGVYNFLAGDGSTFITGQEICVDGGLTAGITLPVFGAIERSLA